MMLNGSHLIKTIQLDMIPNRSGKESINTKFHRELVTNPILSEFSDKRDESYLEGDDVIVPPDVNYESRITKRKGTSLNAFCGMFTSVVETQRDKYIKSIETKKDVLPLHRTLSNKMHLVPFEIEMTILNGRKEFLNLNRVLFKKIRSILKNRGYDNEVQFSIDDEETCSLLRKFMLKIFKKTQEIYDEYEEVYTVADNILKVEIANVITEYMDVSNHSYEEYQAMMMEVKGYTLLMQSFENFRDELRRRLLYINDQIEVLRTFYFDTHISRENRARTKRILDRIITRLHSTNGMVIRQQERLEDYIMNQNEQYYLKDTNLTVNEKFALEMITRKYPEETDSIVVLINPTEYPYHLLKGVRKLDNVPSEDMEYSKLVQYTTLQILCDDNLYHEKEYRKDILSQLTGRKKSEITGNVMKMRFEDIKNFQTRMNRIMVEHTKLERDGYHEFIDNL